MTITWPPPESPSELKEREVHVWAAPLDLAEDDVARLADLLSADERERARRFVFERDRRRFICGRGTLRSILATYLNIEARALAFAYSPRGKPSLTSGEGLKFNLGHSGDLMIAGVTRECEIGVDVELIRPMEDAEEIANRFFSEREASGLRASPASERDGAFFNLWTRKEALLKATGEGLSESLNQVEVSFLAGDPARVIGMPRGHVTADQWTLVELNPAAGFVGALAAPAREFRPSCHLWIQ